MRNIHLGAAVSYRPDRVHNHVHLLFLCAEVQSVGILRPIGDHYARALMRQGLPNLLGHERHERMEKLQNIGHDIYEHALCALCGLAALLQANLRKLDIPVAENIPDEIVELLNGDSELESLKIIGNLFDEVVIEAEHPLILERKLIGQTRFFGAVEVHKDKACGVPELVRKVAARFDLFVGISHVVSGAVAVGKSEAQGICAVFVNDLERIDAVAERLRHFSAQLIADESVDEDGIKRNLTGLLDAGEHHSHDPERDYIVTCDKGVGGIIALEILAVGIRPAEGRERPESRGEPCIKRIGILMNMGAAALRALVGSGSCNGYLAAIVAIPCRDAVTPPELAGDAPVADILEPMEIDLFKALRDKLCLAVFNSVDSRTREGLHADEPLL